MENNLEIARFTLDDTKVLTECGRDLADDRFTPGEEGLDLIDSRKTLEIAAQKFKPLYQTFAQTNVRADKQPIFD